MNMDTDSSKTFVAHFFFNLIHIFPFVNIPFSTHSQKKIRTNFAQRFSNQKQFVFFIKVFIAQVFMLKWRWAYLPKCTKECGIIFRY